LAEKNICFVAGGSSVYCENKKVPFDTIGLHFFTVYGPRQRPDLATLIAEGINKFAAWHKAQEPQV